MQRAIIITSLFLLLASTSPAGEFNGTGMKLGQNSSIFTGNDIPGKGVSSQAGITLGGFLCYKINNRFSLQQEVLITTKGSKINEIGDVYLTNILIYFEFPLLGRMTFRPEHMLKPAIFLGPAVGIKVLAINDVGVLEDIRGLDFSVVLGVGIEVKKFSLDARLISGLVNFDQSADDIDLKNRTISILFGFAF